MGFFLCVHVLCNKLYQIYVILYMNIYLYAHLLIYAVFEHIIFQ